MKIIFYKKKNFQNIVDILRINVISASKKKQSADPHQQSTTIILRDEVSDPMAQSAVVNLNTVEAVHELNQIPEIFLVEEEKMFEQKEAERKEAQILAAERSMKTNFVIGGWFCLFLFIQIVLVPKAFRDQVAVLVGSATRAALPILTAIANFGTVQFVVLEYWRGFQRAILNIFLFTL